MRADIHDGQGAKRSLQRAEYRCARSIISRSSHPACTARPVHTQVYGKEQEAAVARVEDVSAQSCRRDCIDRPVCGSDDLVSAAVRVTDPEARAPRNPVSCGDRASQCGMDKSATDGGLWLGG